MQDFTYEIVRNGETLWAEMTHYEFYPPTTKCLATAVSPDEYFGYEAYDYQVTNESHKVVDEKLNANELGEMLNEFYKYMEGRDE